MAISKARSSMADLRFTRHCRLKEKSLPKRANPIHPGSISQKKFKGWGEVTRKSKGLTGIVIYDRVFSRKMEKWNFKNHDMFLSMQQLQLFKNDDMKFHGGQHSCEDEYFSYTVELKKITS